MIHDSGLFAYGGAILWLLVLGISFGLLYLSEWLIIKVSQSRIKNGKGSLKDVEKILGKLSKR